MFPIYLSSLRKQPEHLSSDCKEKTSHTVYRKTISPERTQIIEIYQFWIAEMNLGPCYSQ
jgi:hypothetical protein